MIIEAFDIKEISSESVAFDDLKSKQLRCHQHLFFLPIKLIMWSKNKHPCGPENQVNNLYWSKFSLCVCHIFCL